METLVYAIIAVVFCASVALLVLGTRQLRTGQTFEQLRAEKRHMSNAMFPKKKAAPKKNNNNNTTKKNKDRKAKPDQKEQPETESPNDSDAASDNLSAESNSSPVHGNSNKSHVEFSDNDVIVEDVAQFKKASAGKRGQNRKISASILVNKSELVVVASPVVTEPEISNHFEDILPKDDVEIKKQKDENKANKKDSKKGKKNASPKAEKGTLEVSTAVDELIAQVDIIAEVHVPKDSPKSLPAKEKQNKKKKNETIHAMRDHNLERQDANVNSIMFMLGTAELTRSEIQILIDYLLNKQQDTIVNHSEWSDDIVQKLKKQLADKEKALAEEQEASAGFQIKLREMRNELNSERMQTQYKLASGIEELAAKRSEVQNLTQEIQFITEKYNNEKQALTGQIQQLQAKLFQDKQNVAQENAQLQQLSEANSVLSNENFSKNQFINDLQEKLHQFQGETNTKYSDYEQKLQDYDMIVRQGETEIKRLTTENLHLRADVAVVKEDYEKVFAMQKLNLEQLKTQVAEQNNKANHLDDSSKVEIRNLQNALDSSKSELSLCRNEIVESKAQIAALNGNIKELTASLETQCNNSTKQVEELSSQLNNVKSVVAVQQSSIVDYQQQLQSQTGKEDELFKQIAEFKDKNNDNVEKQLVQQEQLRTKQILERLFPDAPAGPSDHQQWLNHIAVYIEQYNAAASAVNHQQTTNGVSHQNENDSSTEELFLQNAKLQTTVEEYKTIVAETEGVLTILEKKVKEQDAFWRSVVESKENELRSYKSANAAV